MHSQFLSRSRLTDALRRRWQTSALRARCLEWDVAFAVDIHAMTFSYPPVAGRHTLTALRECVAELQAGNRMEDRTKAVIERALQGKQP